MESYKIYLSRSQEAARRIASSFKVGDGDIKGTGSGMVHEDNPCIPAMYKGYFYCTVKLKATGDNGEQYAPTYELTIC